MKKTSLLLFLLTSALSVSAQKIDYPTQIQTIFTARCTSCHGGSHSTGLSLVSYQALMSSGSYVVVGNAEQSFLYDKIRTDKNPSSGARMPLGSSLSIDQQNLIRDWINQGATATDNENLTVPAKFALKGNFPNPFNPGTTVAFESPAAAKVELQIFNILGQKVLSRSLNALAGANSVYVDLQNQPSGMYLYRISAQLPGGLQFSQTRSMLLSK